MRRIAVLATLLLTSGLTVGVYQVAGADDEGHSDNTINLIEKDTGFTGLDLGDKGDSPGDEEIFSQDFFDRSGHQVGHGAGFCVSVGGSSAQCQATDVISGDQLTVTGLVDFSASGFTVAITGGTGRFNRARGEEIIKETGNGQSITVHLR